MHNKILVGVVAIICFVAAVGAWITLHPRATPPVTGMEGGQQTPTIPTSPSTPSEQQQEVKPPVTSGTEVTLEDLRRAQSRASELNEAEDFDIVGMDLEYTESLGTYNGKPVEFAYKCWGDTCPDNGAFFIRYKDVSKEQCAVLQGSIVEGYSGWGAMTYGGCNPLP